MRKLILYSAVCYWTLCTPNEKADKFDCKPRKTGTRDELKADIDRTFGAGKILMSECTPNQTISAWIPTCENKGE